MHLHTALSEAPELYRLLTVLLGYPLVMSAQSSTSDAANDAPSPGVTAGGAGNRTGATPIPKGSPAPPTRLRISGLR